MLTINIPKGEYFNSETNEFIPVKERSLTLEHSLVSISKWESKWQKPFLSKDQKTNEEIIDYIRCMTLTQNVDKRDYYRIPASEYERIKEYIDAPMTATTFSKDEKKGGKTQVITAEIIYYWMVSLNIPFECQKWHLNRLLTLIKVCNIKNSPKKKMSRRELLNRNRSLNAARRKRLNTTG